jgi:hypothetical protein
VARNSLAAARAELFALMSAAGVPTVAGVTAVYDHEPFAGQMANPVAMTVFTAGMDPDFYQLALRIYQTAEVDAQAAQENLDTLILAVEAKLTSGFNRGTWSVTYVDELTALVATCTLLVGREDHPYG